MTGLTAGLLHLRVGEGLVIGTHGFIANEAEPCVRAEGVLPPLLHSARASQAGAPGSATLVLTFDQPVRAAQTDMYVVLYDESTCDAPNGNSHQLLAGDGTVTITVDASGYVPGTPTTCASHPAS